MVEKESAVLGYSAEIYSQLDADHHTICKYHASLDPNNISVRNVH